MHGAVGFRIVGVDVAPTGFFGFELDFVKHVVEVEISSGAKRHEFDRAKFAAGVDFFDDGFRSETVFDFEKIFASAVETTLFRVGKQGDNFLDGFDIHSPAEPAVFDRVETGA